MPPTLAIDVGSYSLGAAVVSQHGSWIVTDPASGERRWRSARALALDEPVLLGVRRSRPAEQLTELISAVRTAAYGQHGFSIERC